MNKELFVIKPAKISDCLTQMLQAATKDCSFKIVTEAAALPALNNKALLFAVELDEAGYCLEIMQVISQLYKSGSAALAGSKAALLIHSPNEFNTKSAAADMIFQLNQLGCMFMGHPMVEAVGDLSNFKTWQKTMSLTLLEICIEQSALLGQRLIDFTPPFHHNRYIVALHSSSSSTSNTLALWNMIRGNLSNCVIEELHVENGTVMDCKGCSFKTCLHYSKQTSCFYGGAVVEEIYPAVEKADAVVWICPNYNDSVAANISAVINRLTALYRKVSFHDKAMYAVVVSGNSGSDSVAMQLLNSLCINKGFYLPPYFCISATANDPMAIMDVADIQRKSKSFAELMQDI